jgi:hypothetical protein
LEEELHLRSSSLGRGQGIRHNHEADGDDVGHFEPNESVIRPKLAASLDRTKALAIYRSLVVAKGPSKRRARATLRRLLRRRSLASLLFRTARRVDDLEALASGNPKRIERRVMLLERM